MERDADYLGRYRAISQKLKKRFLKKPNVAEGSEQFAVLAKTFKHQDCPQYAAFCCLAQARCEHTLLNGAGEAQALSEAARHFLYGELCNQDIRCPSFQEHLSAAISCYGHAIRVNVENKQPSLAASLCTELGDGLRKLDKSVEALEYYQRAARLQGQNPLECLSSIGEVATCKLDLCDYEGALSVFTEMSDIVQEKGTVNGKLFGIYIDILARCEVTRVLLLMLLKPSPQKIPAEHAQTLEKYAWENGETVDFLSEDLFLLLQSVVLACQSKDVGSLHKLQVELWPLLTAEQNELLHKIIDDFSSPNKVTFL